MSRERRLPPLAEDALDILSAAAEDETKSDDEEAAAKDERSTADFTKNETTAILVADEGFTEEDAARVLEVLFQRGYIYYVDDDVSITPTGD